MFRRLSPTLKTWFCTMAGFSLSTFTMARARSRTWMNGRHCCGPITVIRPSVMACAVNRLPTRSKRGRGECPKTVAKRRTVTKKSSRAVIQQLVLAVDLGLRVHGDGIQRIGLADLFVAHAVDRATGGEDKAVDAERLRDILGHAGGHDVGVPGELFVHGAGRIADQAGQVDHGGSALHGQRELGDVGSVAFDEFEIAAAEEGGERLLAVHEPVEHAHGIAVLQEQVDGVGADIAGAADDQHRSALVDGDGSERLMLAVRQVEQQAGQGQRCVGDESPEDDRSRISAEARTPPRRCRRLRRTRRCFEPAGRGLQAGVDTEDPVEGE